MLHDTRQNAANLVIVCNTDVPFVGIPFIVNSDSVEEAKI